MEIETSKAQLLQDLDSLYDALAYSSWSEEADLCTLNNAIEYIRNH